VVWLWLNGGPSHIETFDPKPEAPREYRSVTGSVASCLPGVALGGNFERLATRLEKLAIIRSFAHQNSGHGGGTHWVMTGYDNRRGPPAGTSLSRSSKNASTIAGPCCRNSIAFKETPTPVV
jgi:hypothetical protein